MRRCGEGLVLYQVGVIQELALHEITNKANSTIGKVVSACGRMDFLRSNFLV